MADDHVLVLNVFIYPLDKNKQLNFTTIEFLKIMSMYESQNSWDEIILWYASYTLHTTHIECIQPNSL